MARAPYQVLVFPYTKTASGFEYAVFRRSDSVEEFWQAIAGGGEDAETPLEAAKREAWEEANISQEHTFMRLDSQATIRVENLERRKLWGGDILVIPEYTFAVEVNPSIIQISEEHTEYRWLSFTDAEALLKYDSNKNALWELNERLTRANIQ